MFERGFDINVFAMARYEITFGLSHNTLSCLQYFGDMNFFGDIRLCGDMLSCKSLKL